MNNAKANLEAPQRSLRNKEFKYAMYWLTVVSDFELPEVNPVGNWPSGPIVHVRRAIVPKDIVGGKQITNWLTVSESQCLCVFPNIASFLIENGEAISVEVHPESSDREMRNFLLGVAFANLLFQRGMLPLHVSSVKTPNGAIAFTGPSGAGKSTKAATLCIQEGWQIISDDVAVVRIIEGIPMIYSGIQRLKLWDDALNRLGLQSKKMERDWYRADKFKLTLPEMFADDPTRLIKIVKLPDDGGQRKSDREYAQDVIASIYRPELMSHVGDKTKLFKEIIKLSKSLKK